MDQFHADFLWRLAKWTAIAAGWRPAPPRPAGVSAKFVDAPTAVALIADGAVVAASGLGIHHRASILYRAIRARFVRTGHPQQLTLMNVGGHGSRGLLPGSLDELAHRGLCTRFISSHFETFHALTALAADGGCELQCIPLGVMALLYDALGRGEYSIRSSTGVGTFIDPRLSRATARRTGNREPLVTAAGRQLCYRIPAIDVALFNLPAADRQGNLYAEQSAAIGDVPELARAAKRAGGRVIATVGRLVRHRADRVFLPARLVDAIVYDPYAEQTAGYFHADPWLALTPHHRASMRDAFEAARLVRTIGEWTGALARRDAVDDAVARLAAQTLAGCVPPHAQVAIGAGFPEEVPRIVFDCGRLHDFTFLVEGGAVGGLPAPGVYFGAAFSPDAILSTAQFFKRCNRHLDAACLGALEVDGDGNVNVSRRGPGVSGFAGPGGFMDFTTAAHSIVFVSGWMRDGHFEIDGDRVRMTRQGMPKFVERVSEITFNGLQAVRAGKQVLFATPVGLFRLSRRGMELTAVMPGIDVRTDIVASTPMRLRLPAGQVPVLDVSIVNGAGFKLPRLLRRRVAS